MLALVKHFEACAADLELGCAYDGRELAAAQD
jgi:hypothetical protein